MRTPEPAGAALDKKRIRAGFERAASSYDGAAYLQRAIGARLLEHLDPVRLEPARVLDLGAGTGHALPLLRRRYRRAHLVALDLARQMLRRARRRGPRLFARPGYVCGDAEKLPLADASIDLVHSNATLQWCPELDSVFAEVARVLRPGGLLVFSSFGPDTLRELRASWPDVDSAAHVHTFIDMHDVGDALVRAGFSGVVLDTERLHVFYPNVTALMRELKALGARNASAARPRGMTGRRAHAALADAYERLRTAQGLPATYEVVYGHAWRSQPAVASVPVSPPRRR